MIFVCLCNDGSYPVFCLDINGQLCYFAHNSFLRWKIEMAIAQKDIIRFKEMNDGITIMRIIKRDTFVLKCLGFYETGSIRFPDDQWKKLYHETKTS